MDAVLRMAPGSYRLLAVPPALAAAPAATPASAPASDKAGAAAAAAVGPALWHVHAAWVTCPEADLGLAMGEASGGRWVPLQDLATQASPRHPRLSRNMQAAAWGPAQPEGGGRGHCCCTLAARNVR